MLTTQGLEESNVNMLSIERSLKLSLMLSWLIESSIFWPLRSIKLCTRASLTPRSKASHCVSLSPQKLSSSFTFPLHILWQYLSDVSPYNQLIKLNPFNTHKQIMYFLNGNLPSCCSKPAWLYFIWGIKSYRVWTTSFTSWTWSYRISYHGLYNMW